MKIASITFVVFLLFAFFHIETSNAAQSEVNISANVPSEEAVEIEGPGSVLPIYDTNAPEIFDVRIDALSFDSAKISWNTNENASAYLYFGKTLSYEIGALEDHAGSLIPFHKIEIRGLEENTVYYFQIRSSDSAGNQSIKDGFNFATFSKKISPDNISGLKAAADDSKIILSWNNPEGRDFDHVLIARSEEFYPRSINEGVTVYSGTNESFVDTNLANGIKYFYSIFSFDSHGNVSSGALVSAIPNKIIIPEIPPEKTPQKPETPIIALPQITPEKPIMPLPAIPDIENISIEDFVFFQDGKIIALKEGKLEIDYEKEIVIIIDAEKIPDDIGSIMIILTRENEEYSYLMKKDDKIKAYSASIKLASEGSFDITIVLLDKNNKIAKAIPAGLSPIRTAKPFKNHFLNLGYIFPLFILFLILILHRTIKKLSKNRKKKRSGKRAAPLSQTVQECHPELVEGSHRKKSALFNEMLR